VKISNQIPFKKIQNGNIPFDIKIDGFQNQSLIKVLENEFKMVAY